MFIISLGVLQFGYCYRDFRPLFQAGQEFARAHGFYMQKYCGCIFSEEDRYMGAKRRKAARRQAEAQEHS